MQKEWANGVSGNPKNFEVKIKSHEKTQAPLDAIIAFGRWKTGQRIGRIQEQAIATEAIFWRKCLFWTINIVMTLARFNPVLQDLLQKPARTAKYLNATIQTESVYSMSVNGVNAIIQHAMSFTLFGTLVIFETPHYDYFITGQTVVPNEILSMGPRV